MSLNNVIMYLVRNTKRDLSNLELSLKSLDTYFNNKYHYPVILFHENLTVEQQVLIKSNTASELIFEQIEFQLPSFLDPESIPETVHINGFGFSVGYRHMCRFFSSEVYAHPVLDSFEYCWRLDTDSFLRGPVDYDVFEFMRGNNCVYGYIDSGVDTGDNDELRQITNDYIKSHGLKYDGWDGSAYGTNFEISQIKFWKSGACADYLSYIDKSGGIYKHRWGDHIIHFIAVSLFLSENQLHHFTDIAYQHQDVLYNHTVDVSILTQSINKLKSLILRTILKSSTLLKRKSKRYKAFRDNKNGI